MGPAVACGNRHLPCGRWRDDVAGVAVCSGFGWACSVSDVDSAALCGFEVVNSVVSSARKADGAPARQKPQHRMWSDTKEKEHKRLDQRARSAPERRN